MELRYYRYFVAVAEELHFGRAAERVHIAQPALSIQIKAMEDTLGGRLFERTRRSVRLTEAGRVFLGYAREMLELDGRAIAETKRALSGKVGRIVIGYTGNAVFSGILGDALREFRIECPDIELQLIEMHPEQQLEALEKGIIQFGFLTTVSLAIPPGIATLRIASWPMLLALPNTHALAKRKKIPVKAIEHEPFIVYAGPEDGGSSSMITHLCGFEPQIAYQAGNTMIMLALVEAGVGMALVPSSLMKEANGDRMTFKSVIGVKTAMDCTVVHRKFEKEPAAQYFIRFLIKLKSSKRQNC